MSKVATLLRLGSKRWQQLLLPLGKDGLITLTTYSPGSSHHSREAGDTGASFDLQFHFASLSYKIMPSVLKDICTRMFAKALPVAVPNHTCNLLINTALVDFNCDLSATGCYAKG